MQKLIKITDDHYVVVDDSKIEVDDWYIDDAKQIRKSVVSDEVYWQHRPYNREYMKITHSTRPFGGSATAISLHEVKELIGGVDVEDKADKMFPNPYFVMEGLDIAPAYREGYVVGYNQALEDNKEKKYTEDDLRRAFFSGGNMKEIEEFNSFIQSLQPKTEWEVEIVDGKLKLK